MIIRNEYILQNTGRTWWKKGHIPWNKGESYILPHARTGKMIICKVCGKEKYFELNQLKKRPCLYCSVICARVDSRKSKLKYSSLHARISRDWGKSDICENCKSTNTIDWANKTGLYKLDRNDWIKLCRKCHIAYDNKKR